MSNKFPFFILFIGMMFLLMTTLSIIAEARGGGRGGGGGFSRGSAARGGSFSSRATTQPAVRQEAAGREHVGNRQGNRQENIGDNRGDREDAREERQERRNEVREDRQDFVEDEWDDHHYHGDSVGIAYVTTLPCSYTAVVVDGVYYYQCSGTWYSRGNQGGSVVYIISDAPAGY